VQYAVKVIRSPDGVARHYTVGQYSIQSLAVWCLHHYYTDFPVYNPYLSCRPRPRSLPPRFKVYSVDGASDVDDGSRQSSAPTTSGLEGDSGHVGALSEDGKGTRHEAATSDVGSVRSRGTSLSSGGRLMSTSHNQRFYDDEDYERRVKKRCARLTVATEEAFSHIRQMQQERGTHACVIDLESAY